MTGNGSAKSDEPRGVHPAQGLEVVLEAHAHLLAVASAATLPPTAPPRRSDPADEIPRPKVAARLEFYSQLTKRRQAAEFRAESQRARRQIEALNKAAGQARSRELVALRQLQEERRLRQALVDREES